MTDDTAADRVRAWLDGHDQGRYHATANLNPADLRVLLDEREQLVARVAEPHQGLTEDAAVQLMNESLGVPVRIIVGDGRPVDGGIYSGGGFDSVQWGRDKRVARVTISVVFPDAVIGPTPENERRMQELRAELDADAALLAASVPDTCRRCGRDFGLPYVTRQQGSDDCEDCVTTSWLRQPDNDAITHRTERS